MLFNFFAEKEGFEPPEVLPSAVFKTVAIDHSAISPIIFCRGREIRTLDLLLPKQTR